MIISQKTWKLNPDFPVLSRNRSIDENNPFDESMEATSTFF
ncbi:hypothetical protein [uncultured Nonlabens sp.]|nr:hypothetical protein [uncultured Nonlabens sp.]